MQRELNISAKAISQDKAIALADQGLIREPTKELRKSADQLRNAAKELKDAALAKKTDETEAQAVKLEAGMTTLSPGIASLEELLSAKGGLNDNTWRHFVCVRQNHSLKLFIDGTLDSSRQVKVVDVTNEGKLVLGTNHVDRRSQNYRGRMDEFLVYNRALSEAEINRLYSLQK